MRRMWVGMAAGAALVGGVAFGCALHGAAPARAEGALVLAPELRTELAFEARVGVDAPLVVGNSAHGLRRVVPINGGTVSGPKLNGTVVPGGADWQVVRPDGVLDIEAKYTLKTDDGVLIMVTNTGYRHGPQAVIDRLGRGEPVDPSEYYFRTSAKLEAPSDSKYAWVNKAVFVGVAERQASAAVIRFYEVK